MAKYLDSGALQAALVRKQCGPANQRYTDGWNDCLLRVKSMVSKAPAADVAPVVHGRWISWEKAGNCVPSPDRHECSVCHDAAQVLVNGFELLSDYCPNCGAKMDGDRKDSGDG